MENMLNKNGITTTFVETDNLKNIDVEFPLGVMTVVTGVSGSGKSTLVNSTLYPILFNKLNKGKLYPLEYKKIEGLDALSASFLVIRPSLPVPTTVDAGISRSANILRAAGATRTGGVGCAGEVTCTGEGAEAAGTAGTSCFTGCDVEGAADEAAVGAFASVSIKHTTCPTFTASPSSACNVIIPLASAGSSRVALSESTSATAWSLVM